MNEMDDFWVLWAFHYDTIYDKRQYRMLEARKTAMLYNSFHSSDCAIGIWEHPIHSFRKNISTILIMAKLNEPQFQLPPPGSHGLN